MGFFSNINQNFGPAVVKQMKYFLKINKKMASLLNRRIFLLRCRSEKIWPNFIVDSLKCLNSIITNSMNINITKIMNLEKRIKDKILSLEISVIENNIKQFQKIINNLSNNINLQLPDYIYRKFINKQNYTFNQIFNNIKQNCIKKFLELKDKKEKIKYQDEWIENLTNLDIPSEVLAVLALGPKFSIKPQHSQLHIYKYLAEIENILEIFHNNKNLNILRAKITNNLTNWLKQPQTYDYFIR